MNILLAASEAFPFAKTGGLADVVGALAQALSRAIHVKLLIPEYSTESIQRLKKKSIDSFKIGIGRHEYSVVIKFLQVHERFSVYFVSQDLFFARKYLYGNGDGDYPDNFHRYLFFQKALFQFLLRDRSAIDVVHCNDWQTALIPLLFKTDCAEKLFGRTQFFFTIHNLGYQGIFPGYLFSESHLPEFLFSPEYLEFHGDINMLKAGIIFADTIITVSPTYAKEILLPENGFGLDGLLRKYSHKLIGILNGIDTEIWNPETDSHIDQNYSPHTIALKKENKIRFYKQEGIGTSLETPLLVFIGRLTAQKGADLLLQALPELLKNSIFLAVLGMGNAEYEAKLRKAAKQHPGQLRFYNFFDEKIAHQLQAAADILIMPSLYEPCGLNQMCSMHYGTIPVVFKTGGLQDTVIDAIQDPSRGNGFVFDIADAAHFLGAIEKALRCFANEAEWLKIQKRGMATDFSWDRVSQKYLDLYHDSLKENRDGRNRNSQ